MSRDRSHRHHHRQPPWTRMTAVLCLAALLGAGLLAAAAPEAAVPDESEIMALTPKIGKFLVKHVGASRVRFARLNGLLDAIFGKDGLGIKYGNTHTKTVEETFESGSGNCLSFTFLFVAMARHVGLHAYFAEISEVMSWDQRGDLVISHKHMLAEVEIDNDVLQVDFLPNADQRYRVIKRINDRRAFAHFYNNLGAEKIAAGDPAGAFPYFAEALENDPTFGTALVNQGVALRKLGRLAEAEASFLQAAELDKGELPAISNLASLYLAQGDQVRAAPYLKKVQDYLQRNPFHHMRLGMQAAAANRLPEAIRHVRDAIRRMPDEPRFYSALADLYTRAQDPVKAQESLEKALKLSDDDDERRQLRDRIAAITAQS